MFGLGSSGKKPVDLLKAARGYFAEHGQAGWCQHAFWQNRDGSQGSSWGLGTNLAAGLEKFQAGEPMKVCLAAAIAFSAGDAVADPRSAKGAVAEAQELLKTEGRGNVCVINNSLSFEKMTSVLDRTIEKVEKGEFAVA